MFVLHGIWQFIAAPFALGMWINRILLRRFDRSRVTFALFWWPIYLVTVLICVLGLIRLIDWSAGTSWEIAAIGVLCVAAIPMYVSFFPACVFFFAYYVELLKWLRIPTAGWALRQLQPCLDWLRAHVERMSNR